MDENTLIEIKNLTVELNNEKIIENLNLLINKGDFLTILGPNGAGKSTLLKAIIGLIPYQQGEITIKNNLKISYLPERLSRSKFKEIPFKVADLFSLKDISQNKAKDILNFVGLPETEKILKKNPANLSSGQFQKVLIAWSLAKEPDILLFDEPMTGIDIGSKQTVYTLLERFRKEKGLTIVMVTHDLNVVYSFSERVLCLYKKADCLGHPKQVLTPQKLEELYNAPIKFYKHSHSL